MSDTTRPERRRQGRSIRNARGALSRPFAVPAASEPASVSAQDGPHGVPLLYGRGVGLGIWSPTGLAFSALAARVERLLSDSRMGRKIELKRATWEVVVMGTGRGVWGSRRRWSLLNVAAMAVASLIAVSVPVGAVAAVSDYVSLNTSLRLVDTRPGASTSDGQDAGIGRRAAGSTFEVQVAGRAGVPVDASTAVLTVTAVDPLANAFLTVHPTGMPRPNASNVNYNQGQNIANTVLARLGVDGKVSIFTQAATHLIVDVSGYFPAGSDAAVQSSLRLADTRPGASTSDGQDAGIGRRAAGSTFEVQVAGRAGVPVDASTAVLTVTAVDPLANAFLTVHPTGMPRPNASNVNYNQGQNIANTVLARLGVDGKVSIFTQAATHLIIDVAGHLPASVYTPLPTPQRLTDTRNGASTIDGQQAGGGMVPANSSLQLQVAGRAGVPADASTAVLTVAAVDPDDDGFLTVHPTGTSRPNASNLNYSKAYNTANTVLARLGAGGDICIFTDAATDLIVDVAGYITGPPPPAAGPTCPLPGEPYPNVTAGTVAEVPGVPFDEVFVLRTLPGGSQPVAASLPSLTQLVMTGDARMLGDFEVWVEVTAPGATGWISKFELVYIGGARDVTADAVSALGGVPTAPTMLELGDIVTAALVPSDPEASPTEVVLVSAPTSGSPSEAVYDTFPGEFFGSDTDRGSRYLVTGVLAPGSPPMWALDRAVAQGLCTRGVETSTGLCV